MKQFKGLLSTENENGVVETRYADIPFELLKSDGVLVQVLYSSLNYKDALSSSGHRGITREFPHIPGIDAAGIVIQDSNGDFKEGDKVIVTGFDVGMNSHGGLAEYISVPSAWLLKLPKGLTLKKSMQLGTAGLTAGMAILALEQNGISPQKGPVLVTGATGGVGMCAILILKKLGYRVIALTGKSDLHVQLLELGVDEILDRSSFLDEIPKALHAQRFAAAIDTVGGKVLIKIVKSLQNEGAVAVCGMVAGTDLPLQIYPFILRGVRMLGIYSADSPLASKKLIWKKLAKEWDVATDLITTEISLQNAPEIIQKMLEGSSVGRYLVKTIV